VTETGGVVWVQLRCNSKHGEEACAVSLCQSLLLRVGWQRDRPVDEGD